MIILLFVVHVLIALALIGVVLLQKSEGGALGMGGGGMSGFMTGRSTANLLTRTTAILAVLFFVTSILLVWFSNPTRAPTSIIDRGGPSPILPMTPACPGGARACRTGNPAGAGRAERAAGTVTADSDEAQGGIASRIPPRRPGMADCAGLSGLTVSTDGRPLPRWNIGESMTSVGRHTVCRGIAAALAIH